MADRYAMAITPAMAALIDPADPDDPIARQFMPDRARTRTPARGAGRPDRRRRAFSPVEGIVHRYPDRVLLKLVHVCPVYCRFCFRREMVGPGGPGTLSPRGARRGARPISRAHPEIWEVIFTGGDPFIAVAAAAARGRGGARAPSIM